MEIDTKHFNLDRFMSRYLCGGPAIRELRKVSRKRLALIDSGVSYDDPEARHLSNLIKIYTKSVQKLANTKITKTRLCKVNKELRPGEKHAGKIRSKEIWFGKTKESVDYKPPKPQRLNNLIGNWTSDVNSKNLDIEEILKLYSRFLLIHPFSDGNGRTGRVLFSALLQKHKYEYIHPDLFRFGKSEAEFVSGLHSIQQDSSHQFWHEWRKWSKSKSQEIAKILIDTKDKLNLSKKTGMYSKLSFLVIQTLWDNPVVYNNTLQEKLRCDQVELDTVISDLTTSGVLVKKKVRNKNRDNVYEATVIIDSFYRIDNLIFDE